MTARERFRRCFSFQKADRLPMLEWAVWWDQTLDAWAKQGLIIAPQPPLTPGEALQRQLGLDLQMQFWISPRTAQTPSPATHGAPIVSSLEEYEAILPTLYPDPIPIDEKRLRYAAKLQQAGDAIVWITLEGPFWWPRKLFGIEPHLYAFYDEPELMERMNRDLCDFNLRALEHVCKTLTPDFLTLAEDMSYNLGPMISEEMFDAFLLPSYRRMVPAFQSKGIRVLIDSDGDITKAVPWFLRAGIEGVLPLERQAGVDIAALRAQYPNFLFIGHFDKMCMPKGEVAMREEFERLLPTMRLGGFIPSVDHQTPPSVTLEQYKQYVALLHEYAQKAYQ